VAPKEIQGRAVPVRQTRRNRRSARRAHSWHFDGGIEVPASSSPHVVRVPLSQEAAVDPEEAFVASIASCHMLWFLSLAAVARFRVDQYADGAVGIIGKNAAGNTAMTSVTLHPRVTSRERLPSRGNHGAASQSA
jgi:organic hydroperoxide reductase OsmC/OhrA